MTVKLLIEDHDGNQMLVTDDLDLESLTADRLPSLGQLIGLAVEEVGADRLAVPAVA